MKHEKNFQIFQTYFSDPDNFVDASEVYGDHENEMQCIHGERCEFVTTCGATRCRHCGERVG